VKKVLVCGGRDWSRDRYQFLHHVLNKKVPKGSILIVGEATGVDTQAAIWAHRACMDVSLFIANWDEFGKRAGPLRNKDMLDKGKPDMVIAFPGGKGTKNMIIQATRACVPVLRVTEEDYVEYRKTHPFIVPLSAPDEAAYRSRVDAALKAKQQKDIRF